MQVELNIHIYKKSDNLQDTVCTAKSVLVCHVLMRVSQPVFREIHEQCVPFSPVPCWCGRGIFRGCGRRRWSSTRADNPQ